MSRTKEKWQEIANRGLQDKFDPVTRAKFDEAVKRGLILIPNATENIQLNEDVPTPENLAMQRPTQEPMQNIADDVIGAAEVAKSIVGGVIGFGAGAIQAAAQLTPAFQMIKLLTGKTPTSYDEAVESMAETQEFFSSQPETEQGKKNMELLNASMNTLSEITKFAEGGAAGLVDIATNPITNIAGGFEQAQDVTASVREQGMSQAAANKVLEETGSPFLSKATGAFFDAAYVAAPMAIGKNPILNPKNIAKRMQTSKKALLVDEIKKGNRNIDNITKAVDLDGNLITNPTVKRAVKVLGDDLKGKQAAILLDSMKSADANKFKKMLSIVEKQRRLGATYAMENRPSNIVGESLSARIKDVVKIKDSANKELRAVLSGAEGAKKVNVATAANDFIDNLRNSGIAVGRGDNRKLFVNLNNAKVNLGDLLPEKKLNNILNQLDSATMTAKEAHEMKRFVREFVDYSGDGIQVGAKASSQVEQAIKKLSTGLGDSIKSPAYKKANAKFSSVADSLALAQKQLKDIGIDSDLATSKLGMLSKRIGTNLASKEQIFDLIDTIDTSLKNNKIVYRDDIRTQVAALSMLDDVFKVEAGQAPFGFVSGVGKGVQSAASGQSATMQALDAGLGKLKSMATPDFNQKMKIMKELSEKQANK